MRTADEIIPRIIVSIPHSSNVPFALNEIAQDVEELSTLLGGLNKVAEIAGISEGMLNQFLRVKKLTPKLQDLVGNRTIDSVSFVHNLAKFSAQDQESIVEEIILGNMSRQDVRLLSPLRKQFPEYTVSQLIEKLKKSEDQKVSVIKFSSDDLHKSIEALRREIIKIVGTAELIDLLMTDKEGAIKMTQKGELQLRKAAKQKHKTLQEFTYTILQ